MKLIDDLKYVRFPGALIVHRLNPERPGETMCGRDVDPWSEAEFYGSEQDAMCEGCAKAWEARKRGVS